MAIITFTTDLGSNDYYVAALKGRIVCSLPTATIIDISNHIPNFDHLRAAYNVKNASIHFPENTIHIIGVIDYKTNSHKLIVAYFRKQYYVSYDTGIFSLLIDDISQATFHEVPVKKHFNTLSPFEDLIDTAIKIAQNKPLQIFSSQVSEVRKQFIWQAQKLSNALHGNIIYIDKFENLVSNISQEIFAEYLHFKGFEIQLQLRKHTINNIYRSYADVAPGGLLALFNYAGYLEIAINQGSAAKLLGLKIGDKLNVIFM